MPIPFLLFLELDSQGFFVIRSYNNSIVGSYTCSSLHFCNCLIGFSNMSITLGLIFAYLYPTPLLSQPASEFPFSFLTLLPDIIFSKGACKQSWGKSNSGATIMGRSVISCRDWGSSSDPNSFSCL